MRTAVPSQECEAQGCWMQFSGSCKAHVQQIGSKSAKLRFCAASGCKTLASSATGIAQGRPGCLRTENAFFATVRGAAGRMLSK